jgi:hypothetical protein
MKIAIRIALVLASANMVIGNLHSNINAIIASSLFLAANIAALVYNEVKPKP